MVNIRQDLWMKFGVKVVIPIRIQVDNRYSILYRLRVWNKMDSILYKKVPIEENDG